MPVPTQPSGVRCLWCFRLAHSAGALNTEKCVQAANHCIYVAGNLFMCKDCGAFSEKRTKLLYRHCRGITTKDAGNFRRRVFAEHVHPTRGTPLPKPVKWWTAPSPQTIEAMEHEQRSSPAYVDKPTFVDNAAIASLAAAFGPRANDYRESDDQPPEADEVRFATAVRGHVVADSNAIVTRTAAEVAWPTEILAPLLETTSRRRSRFVMRSYGADAANTLGERIYPSRPAASDSLEEETDGDEHDATRGSIIDTIFDLTIRACDLVTLASTLGRRCDSTDDDIEIISRASVIAHAMADAMAAERSGEDSGAPACTRRQN